MPMPTFVLEVRRPEPPDVVWSRLWDLDRHTASIPFTTVTADDGPPLGAASAFTAVTSLGPWHLDDRMVVRAWDPPHRAIVEKLGRVRGTIEATLEPGAGGTRLRWRQSIGAVGVPGPVAALLRPLVARGYRASLRRILSAPHPQRAAHRRPRAGDCGRQ